MTEIMRNPLTKSRIFLARSPETQEKLLADYRVKLRTDPNNVNTYLELGMMLKMRGNLDEGKEIFERGRSHFIAQGNIAEAELLSRIAGRSGQR